MKDIIAIRAFSIFIILDFLYNNYMYRATGIASLLISHSVIGIFFQNLNKTCR